MKIRVQHKRALAYSHFRDYCMGLKTIKKNIATRRVNKKRGAKNKKTYKTKNRCIAPIFVNRVTRNKIADNNDTDIGEKYTK